MNIDDWKKAKKIQEDIDKNEMIGLLKSNTESVLYNLEKLRETPFDKGSGNLLSINLLFSKISKGLASLNSMYDTETASDLDSEHIIDVNKSMIKVERFDEEKVIIRIPVLHKQAFEYRYFNSLLGPLLQEEIEKQFALHPEIKRPLFTKSEISFKAYYGDDVSKKDIPDSDNVSIKGIIDSLCPDVILDDNILRLSIHISAKKTTEESFTLVMISRAR